MKTLISKIKNKVKNLSTAQIILICVDWLILIFNYYFVFKLIPVKEYFLFGKILSCFQSISEQNVKGRTNRSNVSAFLSAPCNNKFVERLIWKHKNFPPESAHRCGPSLLECKLKKTQKRKTSMKRKNVSGAERRGL